VPLVAKGIQLIHRRQYALVVSSLNLTAKGTTTIWLQKKYLKAVVALGVTDVEEVGENNFKVEQKWRRWERKIDDSSVQHAF
jgi:hypothetical protein